LVESVKAATLFRVIVPCHLNPVLGCEEEQKGSRRCFAGAFTGTLRVRRPLMHRH